MKLDVLTSEYLASSQNELEKKEEIVLEVVQSINLGRISLLSVVSTLGEYLTTEDATLRARSMLYLQEVLAQLPTDSLSGQHITTMNQFFCSRIADDACLFEALSSLVVLARMKLFTDDDAQETAQSLLNILEDAQQRPQRTRLLIYTLLDILMLKHRKPLKFLGKMFIDGFITLLTGEKDPRNLMLAFSILRIILLEFDIVSQAGDLFDVVYCYFPITFRAQGNETGDITTDGLKLRLRSCLSATHQFALYLIPALIEKLNAVAASVKKDALMTLSACCKIYSARTLDLYTSQLWSALKFEITQSEEGSVQELALDTATAITSCLCKGLSEMPRKGVLARWLQPIIEESLQELKDPELKTAKSCGMILSSIVRSSDVAANVVVQSSVPGLLALIEEATGTNAQSTLIEVLTYIIQAVLVLKSTQEVAPGDSIYTVFSSTKDPILKVLCDATSTSANLDPLVSMTAMACLTTFMQLHRTLSDEDFSYILVRFNHVLATSAGELYEEALNSLSKTAVYKSALILEHTFPILLARLPDSTTSFNPRDSQTVLRSLARLSVNQAIFETLIIRLLSRMDSALLENPHESMYPSQLLDALLQALLRLKPESGRADPLFFDRIVPALFERVIGIQHTILIQTSAMRTASELVSRATRSCSLEKQNVIAADLFSLYFTGGVNNLVRHIKPGFRPFYPDTNPESNTIPLFVGVYSGFRIELGVIENFNASLFEAVLQKSRACRRHMPDVTVALYRMACLMVNKCQSPVELQDGLSYFHSKFDPSCDSHMAAWLCKGLILRNAKEAFGVVDLLLHCLRDPENGGQVAELFSIILGDDPFVTKDSHAVIKKLFKQRFYAHVAPLLLRQETSEDSVLVDDEEGEHSQRAHHAQHQRNCQVALVTLAANVSSEVFLEDLAQLMPALLQCLNMADTTVKKHALSILIKVGLAGKSVLSRYVSSLVPLLLERIVGHGSDTPNVRVAALQFLALLVDILRTDQIQPLRSKILAGLLPALDDPRRSVRCEAVVTRHKFFQKT